MPGPASIHCASQTPGFGSRTKRCCTFTQASASSARAGKKEEAAKAAIASARQFGADRSRMDFTKAFFPLNVIGCKTDHQV
jgi:adenosine/AMP kinase